MVKDTRKRRFFRSSGVLKKKRLIVNPKIEVKEDIYI